MSDPTPKVQLKEYRGIPIFVSVNSGFFTAVWAEDENHPQGASSSSSTLDGVEKLIDAYYNKKAKSKVLNLPVLTETGESAVITGIHLRHGGLTGIPVGVGYVYPPLDWIIAALDRARKLQEESQRIGNFVQKYRMSVSRHQTGGRSELVEGYSRALDTVEEEYARKLKEAQEADVEGKI